jgi:hypothetical protein
MAHTNGWRYSNEQNTTRVSDGGLGSEKNGRKVRRNPSEKGNSRVSGAHELASDASGVLSETSKTQQRREREQEKELERNREIYTEHRAQSMTGAVTAFQRDRESPPRSQTMKERDRVTWQDPEKPGTVDKT